MKHILYDMGNFLQKKYFLSDQYEFLAREGGCLVFFSFFLFIFCGGGLII